MTTPPPGYLGAEGRLGSGPSPLLVDSGYRLEVEDASFLHRGLALADLAHVLELSDIGVIPASVAALLCRTLLEMLDVPVDEFPYDPTYGDAYNSRERYLEERIGSVAGWLPTGRTRREAGRIAFRLAARDQLIALHRQTATLVDSLIRRSRELADAFWCDTTYLQPAQPSTFGHYLGSFAESLLRDLSRIESVVRMANVSPAGAGGVAGTSIPLDRERLSHRLGFDVPAAHVRDGMWSADIVSDIVGVSARTVVTADRLAEDLEIFSSPQFGYVSISSSHSRASVLLPQKRNPYALSVVRGGAGTLIGRATGVLITERTPSARTDNWLYAYGEAVGSLDLAGRLLGLMAEVVAQMTVDRQALKANAAVGYSISGDLAEHLVMTQGLDYRTAYQVVSIATATAEREADGELKPAHLANAAEQVGIALTESNIAEGLAHLADLASVVASRDVIGGSAPHRVLEHCDYVGSRVAAMTDRLADVGYAITQSEALLIETARALAESR